MSPSAAARSTSGKASSRPAASSCWCGAGTARTGSAPGSPQLLKLMLAKSKLLGDDDGGAEIVLASAYGEEIGVAERAMHDLLVAMLPAIDQGLRHVAAR